MQNKLSPKKEGREVLPVFNPEEQKPIQSSTKENQSLPPDLEALRKKAEETIE